MAEGGRDLLIQHAGQEDAGLYTCVASNSVGSNTQQYALQVLGVSAFGLEVLNLFYLNKVTFGSKISFKM